MFKFYRLLSVLILICAAAIGTAPHAVAQKAQTPEEEMIYLVSFGRADDVRLLLEHGVSPQLRNSQNWPVIAVAAARRDGEAAKIVALLIAAGADVNATDAAKNFPLINAVRNENSAVVQALVAAGARVSVTAEDGSTIGEIAERTGNKALIAQVKEAMVQNRERISQERSAENRTRLLEDYAFQHCAFQYLRYYLDSKQDPAAEKTTATRQRIVQAEENITVVSQDLQTLFAITPKSIQHIAVAARQAIYRELEEMVSNRFRRSNGIGKESDLQKRCGAIVKTMKIGSAPPSVGGTP